VDAIGLDSEVEADRLRRMVSEKAQEVAYSRIGNVSGDRNSREWSGRCCLDLTYKTQVVRGADDQRG
jgi:hypothetical protein